MPFIGLQLATLITERTGLGLGGRRCPTCETSTAGSNPALAAIISNTIRHLR
jgi:hypothetical protein